MNPQKYTRFAIVNPNPDEDQKWSMLNGRTAESHFISWGATLVQRIDESGGYTHYMVKMQDGLWRYAHNDSTSCYLSLREAFGAKDGVQANLMRQYDGQVMNYEEFAKRMESAKKQIENLGARINA